MVGLRFEWPDSKLCPNPFPGKDWEIFYQEPWRFHFKGDLVNNYRMNKFRIRPHDIPNYYELACFNCETKNTDQGLTVDYEIVDLKGPWKFYRV
jgi:hypothetical protein